MSVRPFLTSSRNGKRYYVDLQGTHSEQVLSVMTNKRIRLMSNLSSDMIAFLNRHLIEKGGNLKITSLKEFEGLTEIEIIKKYTRIIIYISSKYARDGFVDRDDLVMEGIMGLLDAIERYDPSRNENFHKLALERINGEMYNYFLRNRQSVYVPRYVSIVMSHLENMRGSLTGITNDYSLIEKTVYHRETPEEIKELSLRIFNKIENLKQKIENVAVSQLNSTYEYIVDKAKHEIGYVEIDGAGADFIIDEFVSPVSTEESVEIHQFKERLIDFANQHFKSQKPIDIITLHLRDGLSQTEIHAKLGVTKSYISHVLKVFREEVQRSHIVKEISSPMKESD